MKCYLPCSQPFIRICAAVVFASAAACSQKKSLPQPPPKPQVELPAQVSELDQKAADLYAKKEFDKAVEVYDKAVAEVKQEPALYLARGRVKFQKRDFAGAEADYTEAIKLEPTNPLAYHRRGYTRFELGKYEESIADLTEAIKLKPDYLHAYNNRGRSRTRLKDFEGARQDYETILAADPDYILAYINLIHINLETGKTGEAIEVCERGKQRYEDLAKSGKTRQAEGAENLKESMAVNQHYSMLFFNCAMAQKSAGNKEQSLADIDKAIAISPNGGAYKSVRKDFE